MRILLDECVDERLRHYFVGHVCQMCPYVKLRELANGQLLVVAERAALQVLIAVDKNMVYRQNLRDRAIAVVTLDARSASFEDLVILMPEVLEKLQRLTPGTVVRIAGR